jgi:hypothetical protein
MANEEKQVVSGVPPERTTRRAQKVMFGSVGALSGAVLGGLAGPPGMAAGAVIGGTIGALASMAFESAAASRDLHDEKLDRELGISEGEIGAPNLRHPPAKIGAFSAASSGAGTSSGVGSSSGPIGPEP